MPFIGAAISAIGSAFAAGGIFAAGGTLALVGRFLVTAAISLLSRAIADKPRTPGIRNEQTLAGGVNPATFILGRYATGGAAVCPEMTYGILTAFGTQPDTPNEFLVYVIDVGDIPGGTGLEQLSIDGITAPLGTVEEYLPELPIYENGVDPITGEPTQVQTGSIAAVSKGVPGTGPYAGNLWVKFRSGNETTADPYLRRVFGNYPERPWTEDMIGVGVPHVILTFRRNPKLFQGYPKCRFVVGGIPLYDWRRDSSVGGSGTQRWSDRATWQSSENPVVQTYNILRGIDFGGVDVWGGKAPADAFRLPEWTIEANKADELVSLSGGGTEPQFRAGFEVTAFDEPASVIEELMRGVGGQTVDIGGVWRIRIGAPALPVWLFSDDDVIVSSPQDLAPFPGLDATFNAITATFPDPAMDWEPHEAPPRYNAVWETLDQNRRLPADLNLPATPYPDQVQRVMRAYIEGERRFASHIVTLPPEAGALEPLDTLSWASLGNGYDGKSFELTEIAHDLLGGNVQVSLREVDPADHDWSPSFELPFNRPSSAVVTRPAARVGGAAVSAVTLLDAASAARRPAIKLVWTPVAPGMFQGLEWELRVAGQSAARGGMDQAISTGEMIIVDGVLPATAYQLRARWVANQDVAWTPWLAVTTLDARFGEQDISQTLVDTIANSQAEIAEMIGIKRVETLPAAGAKPDQIVMLPSGELRRWDAAAEEWTRTLFGGIKPGDVEIASFAAGIEPVTIVAGGSLPAVKSTETIVFGGKLYRWSGSAYTSAVPAVDVTGQLTNAQIAALDAAKLSGTMSPDRIGTGALLSAKLADSAVTQAKIASGSVSLTKFATGIEPVSIITGSLPAVKSTEAIVFGGKLYRWSGSAYTAAVATTDLSGQITGVQITNNAVTAEKIAANAVTASKILAGAIESDHLGV